MINPVYSIGFVLMLFGSLFAWGYVKGHHSYKPDVQLIEHGYQNMRCHLTFGHVIKLNHHIVVCAKVKRK